MLPLGNGLNGDSSTEGDLAVPAHVHARAKRGRVVKREQQSPIQSVVLSTSDSVQPDRSRRPGAVRAARVIRALQIDISAPNNSGANGWPRSVQDSKAHAAARPTTHRRKRTRSLSSAFAPSQPPHLPAGHSSPAAAQASSTLAAAFPAPDADNQLSLHPLVPSPYAYDPTPTHNSLKPKRYFCELCTKGFTQKGGLINHTRIHRNERPYNCSWAGCTRAFVQKCNLTRHERVHSGEKPYQCPVDGCGKRFNRKHGLAQHLTHHQSGTYNREQVLSAARPGGAEDHKRFKDEEGQRQQQDCEEDEREEDDQYRGSGSDDSDDAWQSVVGRVTAAAVQLQASQLVTANGGDVAYGSQRMPISLYGGVPLFPVNNGQAIEDVSSTQRAMSQLQQHVDPCGGNEAD